MYTRRLTKHRTYLLNFSSSGLTLHRQNAGDAYQRIEATAGLALQILGVFTIIWPERGTRRWVRDETTMVNP